MEHAKHIIRAVLLLAGGVVALVFVRHFAMPETFGMHGHYRYSSVAEHAAKAPVHGVPGACAECHEAEAQAVAGGKHQAVSCELCHAPLAVHVQEDQRSGQMPVQRSAALCLRCHERLAARPAEFPQIVVAEHLTARGVEWSEDVCWECHENAHDPTGK